MPGYECILVDFSVSEEAELFRGAAREFIKREIEPLETKYSSYLYDERKYLDEDGRVGQEMREVVKQIRKKSAEAGFYSMSMPTEVGGSGLSWVSTFFVTEEIFRHGLGLNTFVVPFLEGPTPMLLHLDQRQRKKYLEPLIRGEQSTCFALTEPHAGSDATNIKTTAKKEGNEWVLNGQKTFISNAPYADFAQILAVTDPNARGPERISAFIVDTKTEGFSVPRIELSMVADGNLGEIQLTNCRVPEENLVGEEGKGFRYAIDNITAARIKLGARCVGLAKNILHRGLEYAKQREAFGQPIGSFQAIQFMLADSATEIYAAENMVLNCCWKADNGMKTVQESSMVKIFTTETLFNIADRVLQIHGGAGLMREVGIEKIFRYSRGLRVCAEGTNEIQRRTIGRTLGL